MPSLNATIPQYPRAFDLRDGYDDVDRKLESAQASASLVQAVLRDIATIVAPGANLGKIVDPSGTGAGTMPRPKYIYAHTPAATFEILQYEQAIVAALNGVSTALDNLAAIASAGAPLNNPY